jgi:drug/metabolite transporter (DMT)-like permease
MKNKQTIRNRFNGIWLGYFFALCAAFTYGSSQVVAKNLVGSIHPLVVASFGLLFGAIVMSFFSLKEIKTAPRSFTPYLKASFAGFFSSAGIVFMLLALNRSPLVVIAPILAINPIFAIILSSIFIGRLEKITIRIIIGAVFVFSGVVLIIFSLN